MLQKNNPELGLKSIAIGSLPHKSVDEAMDLVEKNFDIPFWPQLSKLSREEDMIVQFLEGFPGIVISPEKVYVDAESERFFNEIETFFEDFGQLPQSLDKYAVSPKFSKTFKPFIKLITRTKPTFAKGQIVGPFTLATTLCDASGRAVFYDETLRDVLVKLLTMKALWQIKQIKSACATTTPIIFIDEPSISQLGTSAYLTIKNDEVICALKEISDSIKAADALSAIHCCGKCDWNTPVMSGVDIVNFDAFAFAQNFSLFSEAFDKFLKKGGKIAWGIVPTLDKEALEKINFDDLCNKFDKSLNYLIKKGIDKKTLLENLIITPSCGAGSLSVELAAKAMKLTSMLSKKLSEREKL